MRQIVTILLILITYGNNSVCQDTNNNLDQNLNEYISLKTDRELYLSGEKIRFGCTYHSSSSIESNILYIELFSADQKVLVRVKKKISNDVAHGILELPKGVLSGIYFLRVYTQYMRNFSPEEYPTKAVRIINPSVPLPKKDLLSGEEILLVPEGGKLLCGIQAELAVKVAPELAEGINDVAVVDANGSIMGKYEIYPNGLGLVRFNPSDSMQYSLLINYKDGDSVLKAVPEVSRSGYCINTTTINNRKIVVVELVGRKAIPTTNFITMSVRDVDFNEVFQTSVEFDGGNSVKIRPQRWAEGINYIILSNENNEILSKKAVYHSSKELMPVTVSTSKGKYLQKELVEVNIDGVAGEVISSVSVVKRGTSDYSDIYFPNHIIENPKLLNTYLSRVDPNSEAVGKQMKSALIHLAKDVDRSMMLVSKTVAKENDLKWTPEIRDLSISGVVREKETQIPEKDKRVYLSVIGPEGRMHINETGPNGEFVFSLSNVVDMKNIFLCIEPDSDKDLEILINNDFSNNYPKLPAIDLSVLRSEQALIENMYINQQTEEVFEIKADSIWNSCSNIPLTLGEAELSRVLDNYIDFASIEEVFHEIIPIVTIKNQEGERYFSVFDNQMVMTYDNPLVILDNVPVFNYLELLKIHPSLIERIDVVNKMYMYGDFALEGVISITTKTDNFGRYKFPDNSVFVEYKSISPEASFLSVPLPVEQREEERFADFRTTLYWKPDITITSDTTVSFYTSDHCSEYDVIVNGITKDGIPVYGKTTFKVERE